MTSGTVFLAGKLQKIDTHRHILNVNKKRRFFNFSNSFEEKEIFYLGNN